MQRDIYKFWLNNYNFISCSLLFFGKGENLTVIPLIGMLFLISSRSNKKNTACDCITVNVGECYAEVMINKFLHTFFHG